MRTYDHHIYIQFRSLLKNHCYRWPMHKKRCRFQAFFAQSLRNLLNLAMLVVEFFCQGFSGRLRIRFKFQDVRCRLCVMQNPDLC